MLSWLSEMLGKCYLVWVVYWCVL